MSPVDFNNLPIDLSRTPLFRSVGMESVGCFLENCHIQDVEIGTTLVSPEIRSNSVYLVLRGSFSVYLTEPRHTELTSLQPGDIAGEMAIIEDAFASAYVVATTAAQVLCISEDDLWRMINSSHAVAVNLLLILCSRLRFDNEFIINSDSIMEQYRRNAFTDALTDLHNRFWMLDMFARKIKRAIGSSSDMCLAMLDLDEFKSFNDRYGHQRGDEILRATADAMRNLFRPTDLIARFGGDEFAVLLPSTDINAAYGIGERVRIGINRQVLQGEEPGTGLTVSIGLAQVTPGDDLNSLLARADAALYRAKQQGRNRVDNQGENG